VVRTPVREEEYESECVRKKCWYKRLHLKPYHLIINRTKDFWNPHFENKDCHNYGKYAIRELI